MVDLIGNTGLSVYATPIFVTLRNDSYSSEDVDETADEVVSRSSCQAVSQLETNMAVIAIQWLSYNQFRPSKIG